MAEIVPICRRGNTEPDGYSASEDVGVDADAEKPRGNLPAIACPGPERAGGEPQNARSGADSTAGGNRREFSCAVRNDAGCGDSANGIELDPAGSGPDADLFAATK